jgi:hypothetical protein
VGRLDEVLAVIAQGLEDAAGDRQQPRRGIIALKAALEDLHQTLGLRVANVKEDAAAQERLGELTLGVAGDDHERPGGALRAHHVAAQLDVGVFAIVDGGAVGLEITDLGDLEVALVELEQQVVREVARGLVDLVDAHDLTPAAAHQRDAERAQADIITRVAGAGSLGLGVGEADQGVVVIEEVAGAAVAADLA